MKHYRKAALACAAVLLGILTLTGCSPVSKDEAQAALDRAVAVMDTYEDMDAPAFLAAVDGGNGYEVLSVKKRDGTVMAMVRVYAPDLYSVGRQLTQIHFSSQEEAMQGIEELVRSADIVERRVELRFTPSEEGYAPVLSGEFLDAYYGGFLTLYEELLTEQGGAQ